MKGTVLKDDKVLVDDVSYPLSKYQPTFVPRSISDEVEVSLFFEYPDHCDENPFCEGDETCQICFYNNKVAYIKTNLK